MQIFETKLSKKNQTVIPAEVRKVANFDPGDKIIWKVVTGGEGSKITIEAKNKSLTESMIGLGKGTWGVEPQRYVDELREEWN